MKAAFRLLVLLAALPACRATAPPARNTLPRRQPLTEVTTPENAEPSRKAGLELPDTTRREVPQQP
ncbi:hypothetical protein [Hymenobacter ruricola]|uniref:Uncharacterized protein n=1 Tax=Hymenobacter ruricola TaxID=2791023 RepID=A0ABS0I6M5_9BACT|nr:hypothetical protein [Hymenobacter ruricola]MBF9222608.1 hypothetical protein [Hymenobacter ruricola]